MPTLPASGTGISDPTSQEAIRNVDELKYVVVSNRGSTFKLSYPERWLKVAAKVQSKYGGTLQGELIRMYYGEQTQIRDIVTSLKISRTVFFTLKAEIISFAEGVAAGLDLHLN